MTDVLTHLPKPAPDVRRLETVLRRGRPDRVPLVELMIADEVLGELHGRPLAPLPPKPDRAQLHQWAEQRVEMWWRLGYDYYRVRAEIPFTVERLPAADTAPSIGGQRQWVNEREGLIRSWDDVERYRWPSRADIDFSQSEAALECLRDGMGGIGFSGGVLEWSSTLLGLETFAMALYDDPKLVREVVDRVGRAIYDAFDVFCEMDTIFAIWLGDDMGFKTATLLSPEHLREFILPWHKKYADLAHRTGRLFMLHSCGYVEPIMPDLVEDVKIDAKHSFEDAIVPVTEFKQRWGGQVAVLGGVDVDILTRGTPDDVRNATRHVLDTCAVDGGYACGSGNSVPNYVPAQNYLAMVETLHRFNAR
jgi:uroporphyrinogen decarboxylase